MHKKMGIALGVLLLILGVWYYLQKTSTIGNIYNNSVDPNVHTGEYDVK